MMRRIVALLQVAPGFRSLLDSDAAPGGEKSGSFSSESATKTHNKLARKTKYNSTSRCCWSHHQAPTSPSPSQHTTNTRRGRMEWNHMMEGRRRAVERSDQRSRSASLRAVAIIIECDTETARARPRAPPPTEAPRNVLVLGVCVCFVGVIVRVFCVLWCFVDGGWRGQGRGFDFCLFFWLCCCCVAFIL